MNNIDHFANFATRVQAIRRCGSAALDLCYVACGRFDGFWEMKLNPWDVAAGALIVEESGFSGYLSEAVRICGKVIPAAPIPAPFRNSLRVVLPISISLGGVCLITYYNHPLDSTL